MNIFLHKIEKLVDKLIPICLLILIPIIIIELFYEDFSYHYHNIISFIDSMVVLVFFADLVFKYIRVHNVPKFLRRYWLDILAIFPFYTVFRIFEKVAFLINPLSEGFQSSQMIIHEGLEIEKEGSKIIKEAGRTSRFDKFSRYLLRVTKIPRLLKLASYFEQPTGEHHHYERANPRFKIYNAVKKTSKLAKVKSKKKLNKKQ